MLRRVLAIVAVALPPLVLAGIGVTHPTELRAGTAEYWRDLHIATLLVFPLLGFAPFIVVGRGATALSAAAAVLGFVYAIMYTALDVLSGIGAGAEELAGHPDAPGTLFDLGTALGRIGSICLILAAALVVGEGIRRWGPLVIPGGVVVLAGTVVFLLRHIYFPVGVVGQLLIALGWVGVLLARWRAERTAD